MKNQLLIVLLLVSNSVFSQLTLSNSTAWTGLDTLKNLNGQEVKLINKVIVSERYYRNMFDLNTKEINNLKMQIDFLNQQNNCYVKIVDDQKKLVDDMNAVNEKFKKDLSETEDLFLFQYNTRMFWKGVTIVGIPVSFTAGILLANKFIK